MHKIREKVKDLVEVKRHEALSSFWLDPQATLGSYHFTDGTAELMAKWLGTLSGANVVGKCRAVAGFRGVGKSHFLSVFAAITAHPELRAKIEDPHVQVSSQSLLRRHYPVVNVRRGSGKTLAGEFSDAAFQQFGLDTDGKNASAIEIIEKARIRSGDLPLVLIVDTAPDRPGQIDRNDGAELSEIARFCKTNDIFLAVALDDDIAGADGDNVSIIEHFEIDYIDPENLYKAVNARIFVKEPRKQEAIRSVYKAIRETTKDFRWSEERFCALYPLHPVSVEITPFIRRYVPNFSILDFASTAGERILSRPADSLIGLEELFEASENDLRKSRELDVAFEAFDKIQANVVEKVPIKDRHRIKLILKALLLLSLDGTGKSAQEIVAGLMLPRSEDDPVEETSRILDSFAAASSDGISAEQLEGASKNFCFRTGLDEHSAEITRWIDMQGSEIFAKAFVHNIARKFPEFGAPRQRAYGRNAVPMELEWRGSLRRGLLIFGEARKDLSEFESDPDIEWEVYFDIDMGGLAFEPNTYPACVSWRPDAILPEERRVLLGSYALTVDQDLRNTFGDDLLTAEQAHSSAASRIIDRVVLENARLEIEGFDYNFTEAARNARSLSEAMSTMLEPVFETRYFEHPVFSETLTEDRVESFVRTVFNGPELLADTSESTARVFGAPLGIVRDDADGQRRANKDEISELAICKTILELVEEAGHTMVTIPKVDGALRQPPLGLCVEARRLVLAALTANGSIELVSKGGERVNGRSLDLKVDWNAVDGIVKPREGNVTDEMILKWARTIACLPDLTSLHNPEHRSKLIEGIVDISVAYANSRKPGSFGEWQELGISSTLWRDIALVSERYQKIIEPVDNSLAGEIELEACVASICNSFADRTNVFAETQESAARIETHAKFQTEIERMQEYISVIDHTTEKGLEDSRGEVLQAIDVFYSDTCGENGRAARYAFERFSKLYSQLYCESHASTFGQNGSRIGLLETLSSELCARIRSAFILDEIGDEYRPQLREYYRFAETLSCDQDPAERLKSRPHCTCSFGLSDKDMVTSKIEGLESLIADGLRRLDAEVATNRELVAHYFDTIDADPDVEHLKKELRNPKRTLESGVLPRRQFDLLVDALASVLPVNAW